MAFSSLEVANIFIDIAKKNDAVISPMKLQKLVYCAHGWYFTLEDKPLLNEQVGTWSYGVVIPFLYHEFKGYGNKGIKKLATTITIEDDFNIKENKPIIKDGEIRDFLEKI